jgi:hypothetical protein
LRTAAQKNETGQRGDECQRMEKPVRQRIVLESRDRRRRMAASARQHVMPLEYLVKQHAVEETAEPDPEQNACGPDGGPGGRRHLGAGPRPD